MNDFFEILRDFDFDDLNVTFIEAKLFSHDLALITQVENEADETVSDWRIVFEDTREHHLSLGYQISPPYIETEHVLLWPYTKPHSELYFKGLPSSFEQIVAALYGKHVELVQSWVPFGRNLAKPQIIDFLKVGYGLFAEGPDPLIQGYADVMREFGMQTSILSRPPRFWRGGQWMEELDQLQVFISGNSFVVSKQIKSEKV